LNDRSFRDFPAVAKRIPLSIRWSILVYAFLLPFERTDFGIFSGSLSVARIAGLLVIVSCLLYPRLTISVKNPVFWCFALYLVFHFAHGAWVNDSWNNGFLESFLTRTQVVIFAWLLSSVLTDTRVAAHTFAAFAIGCVVLVSAMLLALPGLVQSFQQQGVERVTFGGADPNFLGAMLAIAMVMVVGLTLGRGLITRRAKIVLVPAMVLLPMGIFLTRSRASIICLFVGVVLYLIPLDRLTTPFKRAPLVLGSLVIFTLLVFNSPESLTRLASTFYEGNTSGRDKLLAAAYPMFLEKPVWGWGPVAWQERLNYDIHNHFVYLLLEGGILGSAPYFIALLMCCWSVWRARTSDWGKLCFAVLLTLFFTKLSINFPSFKAMWLVFAACAALTLKSPGIRTRPRVLLRYRR
jgi:hypothetical protein